MAIQSMSDIDSGYRSSQADWEVFLSCWREAVDARLRKGDSASGLDSLEPDMNGILAPGTEAYETNRRSVLKLEARLGRQLPASYRDFALLTGGQWFIESLEPIEGSSQSHLTPVDEVGLFKEVDAVNWNLWMSDLGDMNQPIPPEVYYRYGYQSDLSKAQDEARWRSDQLAHMIKVGELEQGTLLLLNPRETTSDGEWEAWVLSPQFPGAARYRSFAEMMQVIAYQDILEAGGAFLPAAELNRTCARHLKTAANTTD